MINVYILIEDKDVAPADDEIISHMMALTYSIEMFISQRRKENGTIAKPGRCDIRSGHDRLH